MSAASPTTCPTCGKVVDPLRARSVGVRDGKVVAYCSAVCASAAESRPVSVKIRTPAAGIAVVIPTSPDSGPIIEIIREGSVPTQITDSPSGKTSAKFDKSKRPKKGDKGDKGDKADKTKTPVAGTAIVEPIAAKSDAAKSGPVKAAPLEIKSEKSAPARRDHTPTPVELAKRQAELAAAEEADEDAMINGDDAPPERKLPMLLIAVIVIAVGGGVALAIKMMSKSGTAHAASASAAWQTPVPTLAARAEAPAPVATPAPPAAAVLDQARGVLRAQLASGSPRVQRHAAAALARTGDADALEALAGALHDEPSEINRLDLAYALARGADARGTAALVTALASQRRDVRAEAANQLARLGDARATPVLAEYLEVSQLRVGAAEHLAYIGEPHALKLLDALRADPKTSVDDRARAVVALGIAGRADVTADLRALLVDPRFNAFAAASLAALHDPAARPLLVEHLAIPSLRTDAARALRRLDPDLDAAPLLPPLATALASTKDTDAAQAAEAVLLLAGPPAWSQYE